MWKVIVDSFDAHSATSFRWWPSSFSLGGYGAIISRASLYRPFLVSVITTLAGTFMGLLLATLGGYVLIQWEILRKKLLRIYVIIHNDFRWWYGS